MTRMQRVAVFSMCVSMAAGSLMPSMLRGAGPAVPGGNTPPATAPGARSQEAIVKDLTATQAKLQELMPSLVSVADPAFRAGADGQKALPLLKKMVGYFKELEGTISDATQRGGLRTNRYRFEALIAAFGDKDTLFELETTSKGNGPEAISAKSSLALGQWLAASKSATDQTKVLDSYTEIAKANPESEEVAMTLAFMSNFAPANDDVAKKALEVIRTNLKGAAAQQLLAQADTSQAQKDMLGKPLTILGRTSTGGTFTSATYKGKVVLVDFWATWCGPCIGELPHVKDAYKLYHDKGFEIVGVSCDTADGVLNDFTKENAMPWTQLREESQNEGDRWHPLAKKYGVDGIPTMFLIDKKGVLRYVDARDDLAGKVKTLLAEGNSGPAMQPAK
jgi:thiol-disulfide isomerase/thioredoxin